MTTYAVGDIQGCFDELILLLEQVDFSPSKDTLWAAGDLINRGPKSLITLRYLHALGSSFKCVLGNHDLHLMAVASGAKQPKRKDTLTSVLDAPDCDELIGWLHTQPLIHSDDTLNYTMVHAGIPPFWSIKQATKKAAEVHKVLQDNAQSKHFFEHMYGNTPDLWHNDLKGYDRLRVITNYLTRMRFCNLDGRLELETKTEIDNAPNNFYPWFRVSNPKLDTKRVLFGHWAALMGETGVDNIIALDTGCVWGGAMTLLNLDTQELTSQECDCRF